MKRVGRTNPVAAVLAAVTALLAGCGTGNNAAGDTAPRTESLSVDGTERTYRVYRPEAAAGSRLPLILAFHGGQGSGQTMARQTRLHDLAARAGCVVAYPDSLEYWQDGRATTGVGAYDVRFVRELVAHLVANESVDAERVYATGLSNGGMFTLRLACEANDLIAAFAPVIASFPVAFAPSCEPGRPVPVMMVNGTDDGLIQWGGGEIFKGRRRGAGGTVIPVEQTVAFWRENNGCAATPVREQLPDRDPDDGTTVQVITYSACAGNSAVTLVRIDGGGHTWPSHDVAGAPLAKRLVGRKSRDYDASSAIWAFFQRHTLP